MFTGPLCNEQGEPYRFFVVDDGALSPREPGPVEVELQPTRTGQLLIIPIDSQEFEEPEIPVNHEQEEMTRTLDRRTTPFRAEDFVHHSDEAELAGHQSLAGRGIFVAARVGQTTEFKWHERRDGAERMLARMDVGEDDLTGIVEVTVPPEVFAQGEQSVASWLAVRPQAWAPSVPVGA